LTGGSQAIAVFDAPGLFDRPGLAGAAGRFRTSSWATGTRTTTEVSSRPTLRIVIVSVWFCAALIAERSALAARLMSAAGAIKASCRRLARSWPDANWTAPNAAVMARAAKIALNICDMAIIPRHMAITNTTRTEPKGVRRLLIT